MDARMLDDHSPHESRPHDPLADPQRRIDCPHAAPCGACALLDLAYGAQLERKEDAVLRALESRRPGAGAKLLPCLPSPRIAGYRHRARMAVGLPRRDRGPGGSVHLGYFRQGSREIVDAPDCRVLVPELLETTRSLRRLLERQPEAFPRALRHVDLRCGSDPARQHLILVVRRESAPPLPLDAIRAACPHVAGISVNLNTHDGPQVLKGPLETLWGTREVYAEVAGLSLRISPMAFFHVNPRLLPPIHERMVHFFSDGQPDGDPWGCLADLYAGVGTHGLALRGLFERLVFVEGVRAATSDLKATLEHYAIDHAEVVAKPVERSERQLAAARPDAMIVNPSRGGLRREVLPMIVESPVRRLAYLGSDLSALARDLDTLVREGFRLDSVQPIDVMPQTRQVEALAFLRR